MNSFTTRLSAMKERLEHATPLPYKQFPIVMVSYDGNGEQSSQSKLMNEYLDHGLKSISDMALLIAALERAVVALEQIDNEWCLHPGMPKVDDHRQWCSACTEWIYPNEGNPAKSGLSDIERMFSEGEGK